MNLKTPNLKTLKKALLLTFLASSAATGAFAQTNTREAGERACGRDASRFCKAVINESDMTVLACLQKNRTKLSGACQKVLRDNGVWEPGK
ncbi:hypothetical protein [Bradyrhizobium sp. LHD-71]|uniref:hypothetical protein n=1 Tax=Bradyrhizobium sp. LHD-71 TaxID=3072141 RepID=UPI00280D9DC0|nr:hypothetical protein [Bradyrhizobium sp. LHD-71]MDQ8731091.1 hypothetical protein [Bradyrhizobium sp. LHD-71]